MDVVRIFDTTLRDGEQSPGFSMNTDEKIRMARQLAQQDERLLPAAAGSRCSSHAAKSLANTRGAISMRPEADSGTASSM